MTMIMVVLVMMMMTIMITMTTTMIMIYAIYMNEGNHVVLVLNKQFHGEVSHLTCIKLKAYSYYKKIYYGPHSVLCNQLMKEKQSRVNSLRHEKEIMIVLKYMYNSRLK